MQLLFGSVARPLGIALSLGVFHADIDRAVRKFGVPRRAPGTKTEMAKIYC